MKKPVYKVYLESEEYGREEFIFPNYRKAQAAFKRVCREAGKAFVGDLVDRQVGIMAEYETAVMTRQVKTWQ